MKILVALILLSSVSAQILAQCQLTAATAPAIRGLRLGDDLETIKRKSQTELFPPKGSGLQDVMSLYLFPSLADKPIESLKGVDSISLTFFKGRLYQLRITYDGLISWPSPKEFYRQISTSLSLPDKWTPSGGQAAMLSCGDIQFSASVLGKPNLEVVDLITQKARVTHGQETEKQKRAIFRP